MGSGTTQLGRRSGLPTETVTWRRQQANDGTSNVVWLSPLVHLVDSEDVTDLQHLAMVADCANGAGAALEPERFLFMNTDTVVHLHRLPVGKDFALRARGWMPAR